ncbi:MAG: metallophosphoesterase [Halanaeroarchaeum sp.]
MSRSFVLDGRAVYVPTADALVIADLHLGRDSTSEVELPLGERTDLVDRLIDHLAAHDPSTVVLAGDVLHSFGTVPGDVPETVDAVVDRIEGAGADVRVLEGNHDTMLGSLLGGAVQATHRIDDDTVVAHGHERPAVAADRYVVGHEHPAITVEGDRRPCALDCDDQYDGAAVLVVPAYTRLARGTVVNGMTTADAMSPLLTDLDACSPIVSTGDGQLRFPPLGEFRSLL